jgi:hypothetical protein
MNRIDDKAAASDEYAVLWRMISYIAQTGIEDKLRHLAYLCVSQITGCSYFIGRHCLDAMRSGGLVTANPVVFRDSSTCKTAHELIEDMDAEQRRQRFLHEGW